MLSRPNYVDGVACLVRNLSAGGAMLLGIPSQLSGHNCRVALTAPGLTGEELDALVVRTGTTTDGVDWAAIEFLQVSIEAQHRLEQCVLLELSRAAAPAVLVVDGNQWKLAHVAEQLAQYGRRALLARTLGAAVAWVIDPGQRLALALIGEAMSRSDTANFLKFLENQYPTVHRATFDEPVSEKSVKRLLDRVEAEHPHHAPWLPGDLE